MSTKIEGEEELFLFPIDNNTYFTLTIMILLNYVVGWQSRSFLAGLLQYLAIWFFSKKF